MSSTPSGPADLRARRGQRRRRRPARGRAPRRAHDRPRRPGRGRDGARAASPAACSRARGVARLAAESGADVVAQRGRRRRRARGHARGARCRHRRRARQQGEPRRRRPARARRPGARSAPLLPVDSEHSALHQLLRGRGARRDRVARRDRERRAVPRRARAAELADVTPEQALRHPTWAMGARITIDSATLMNKGLEVIEAHWLFGVPYERIEVVVQPQSIVHALVRLRDGALLAHLGLPDMRVPIAYALAYPRRARGRRPAPRPHARAHADVRARRQRRLPLPRARARRRHRGRARALRAERGRRGGRRGVPRAAAAASATSRRSSSARSRPARASR